MVRGPYGKERTQRYEQWRNPKVEEGGVIYISGSFLVDHEEDILNLIRREDKLAQERNPQFRVEKIDKMNGKITVETSEHNLALRIGKALSHAYKGRHRYHFPKGEKYVEVEWARDEL